MNRRTLRSTVFAAVALTMSSAIAATTAPPATAATTSSTTEAASVAAAVEKATGTIATSDTTVSVPTTADGTITARTAAGSSITITLPGTGSSSAHTVNGTTVYPDSNTSADLAVQPTGDGSVRSLITINNNSAAHEYRFDLGLPAGATLTQLDDGSVLVLDGDTPLGIFNAPWAKDRNAKSVPTGFRVDGTALVQTVEFNRNTAFPVIADPWYNPLSWDWGTIFDKFKSCGSGTLQFIGADQAARVGGTAALGAKLAQAGLRVKNVSPGGVFVAASAGCIIGAIRNW
ncbi:hypothetical protein [Kitasatospora sp. NPDC089509]|uniref:hypothetical protein n=1 Tax=Kitasatospora sp. NPDC089509 TaxID=3364079 RepID=UPI0038281F04